MPFQHQYPKNSVVRKMLGKEKIPQVFSEQTLGQVSKFLKEKTPPFETINYLYVIDDKGKLIGIVSIKEVFRCPQETKVSEIMEKNLVVAYPQTSLEKVATLAIKYNLKAIPIIEKDGSFSGIVSSDTILNILHEAHIEDILYSVGISPIKDGAKTIITAPTFLYFKKRLPWLLVGLAGGIMAAFIVGFFENALKTQLILALFIPLIVYMADAVGAQTQTLYIRSIALEQTLSLRRYILREVKVGLALALSLGGLITIFSILWWQFPLLGLILGTSIFVTVLTAMAIAIFLPWFFLKMKYDPAIASGPFATVIRDILSLLIYFGLAQIMLKLFN